MTESKLGVALVKELCPACLAEMSGPIIMNQRLTKSAAEKVEKMHGQVVGIADRFCEQCEDYANQGIIFVGIDESKTEDMSNPYRTGLFAVVKEAAVKKFIHEPLLSKVLDKRMTYIEHDTAVQLGMIPSSGEENDPGT